MEIIFTPEARAHLAYWQENGNVTVHDKISELLKSIRETPFTGIGKPERLKHNLAGKWSRRINREHRIVYQVKENSIYIYSLKGHY